MTPAVYADRGRGWRTAPLPPNWHRLRAVVLERDSYQCTARDSQGRRCTEHATDVDHVKPASQGGDDSLDNLAALCRWHHARKTSAEARAAQRPRPRRAREPEQHPAFRRD